MSDSGGCTIISVVGQEKKRAEERLRACGVLSPREEINGAVEAVSFDNTLGELQEVVGEGLKEDRMISSGVFGKYVRSYRGLQ